ncbi:MAG: sulfatase [Oligoflexales bacterium]
MKTFLSILAFSVAFILAQQAFLSNPNMMGMEAKSLAWGIVSFFPMEAVIEEAKLVLVTFVWFGFVWLTLAKTRKLMKKAWSKNAATLVVAAALLAFWFAPVWHYPAMFDSYLPQAIKQIVFRTSFFLADFPVEATVFGVLLFIWGWFIFHETFPKVRVVLGVLTPRRAVLSSLSVAVPLSAGYFWWHETGHDHKGPADKPNVVLLVVDSMRVDRAVDGAVMPSLHALASDSQSVFFHDHHIGVPRTFPSWIEFLSGKYAVQTGVRHMFPGLEKRSDVFDGMVSQAKRAGYRTAAVSDFAGDIFPRFDAGFDEIRAPKLSIQTMIRMGTLQSAPASLAILLRDPLWRLFGELKQDPNFADPRHIADDAVDVASSGSQPYFLTLFFSTAHFPYAAPYPWYNKFADPSYRGSFCFLKNPNLVRSEQGISDEDIRQIQGLYNGALGSIDEEIGRVVAHLKESGQWDNTLFVVTADHGESVYDDGASQGHGEEFAGNQVHRVPLLMKLPLNKKPALRTVEFLTRSIDLSPTIQGLLGFKDEKAYGVDLSDWLLRAQPPPRLAAYMETGIWFTPHTEHEYNRNRLFYPGIAGLLHFNVGGTGDIVLRSEYESMIVAAKHRAWVEQDYKLIYEPTAEGVKFKLFNRRNDPANRTDLAAKEPQKLREMKSKLFTFLRENEWDYKLVQDYFVPKN